MTFEFITEVLLFTIFDEGENGTIDKLFIELKSEKINDYFDCSEYSEYHSQLEIQFGQEIQEEKIRTPMDYNNLKIDY